MTTHYYLVIQQCLRHHDLMLFDSSTLSDWEDKLFSNDRTPCLNFFDKSELIRDGVA
jgi:hypothetical protein